VTTTHANRRHDLIARREHLLDQLETRVLELQTTATWQRYLAVQSRFHHYSHRNVLLISMQRPEATSVAGFRTWEALGRYVLKGERGISILAPMIVRGRDEEEGRLTGFRWVSVFDVSQTDGAPLPSPVTLLRRDEPAELTSRLIRVASTLGFDVVLDTLPPGVNGECRWSTATIVVERANAPLQRAKTLAHELGHVLLHRTETDRARAEIEAESVAYIVLAASGADAAAYSAGYVASWLGPNADVRGAIQQSCQAIQSASAAILDGLAAFRTPPAIRDDPEARDRLPSA